MKDEFLRIEKKPNAKEIRENLTEEGKRLELVVQAELQKRHEQAQELDQLKKNIESSAKEKVKDLKVQEKTLSQEGQRLQDLVNTIREHRAQDKDGNFLDKLFSQGAEKITDAMDKGSDKADDSIKQTLQTASDKFGNALQKPEPPLPDLPPEPASQGMKDRSYLDLPLEKKNLK